MRKSTWVFSSVAVATVCSLALMLGTSAGAASEDQALLDKAKSLFKPLPDSSALENTALTPDRVALGKALFFETRVSSDGRQGCGSCHNPSYHGGDSLPLSMGVHGKVLPRNAPTVFNTSLLVAQHYGGSTGSRATALVHLDLYRLEQPAAADELLAQEEEEAQACGALLAVEWPGRLSRWPAGAWQVELLLLDDRDPDRGRLASLRLP